MTIEEAIRRISNAIFIAKALNIAVEALEKQIPKKPIAQEIQRGIPYACPSCGKGAAVTNYCHHCGQALDWSEENAE